MVFSAFMPRSGVAGSYGRTLGLVDLRSLFHCLFFLGIFLVLLIGSSSSPFSFYLYFSDSMNLGETFIYCGLEGLFLCGSNPV